MQIVSMPIYRQLFEFLCSSFIGISVVERRFFRPATRFVQKCELRQIVPPHFIKNRRNWRSRYEGHGALQRGGEAANVRACRLAGAISRMSATYQHGLLRAAILNAPPSAHVGWFGNETTRQNGTGVELGGMAEPNLQTGKLSAGNAGR